MHPSFTTTICIEVITCPYLVSYQCKLSLLIWIMHLLTPYYSTNQSEIPKSSRKHLNHSHMDYTSFKLFKKNVNTSSFFHNDKQELELKQFDWGNCNFILESQSNRVLVSLNLNCGWYVAFGYYTVVLARYWLFQQHHLYNCVICKFSIRFQEQKTIL